VPPTFHIEIKAAADDWQVGVIRAGDYAAAGEIDGIHGILPFFSFG
jgi:hypothetical protein